MSLLLKQIPDLPEAIAVLPSDLIHIRNGSVDKKITYANLVGGHVDDKNNPHEVTKAQLGLDNLTGNAVLEQAKNLSDVPDKALGRFNLGVPSVADLQTAVPTGVITLWYGLIVDVPVGYALCDGLNGTPDLRGKFLVGATAETSGRFPNKTSGGALTSQHTHGVSVLGHSLTAHEIPEHSHVAPYAESHSVRFGVEPNVSKNQVGSSKTDYDNWSQLTSSYMYDVNRNKVTGAANSHNHNSSVSTAQVDIVPPYYALAYIMKL